MTQIQATENEYLHSLTGRKLKISGLSNPSNVFWVGVVCAYDIYPGVAKSRVKQDR
jgi:hypothetical protein